MTSNDVGTDNGGHGFDPRPARVDVRPIAYADAPPEWQRAVRFIGLLREVFGDDEVIDIDGRLFELLPSAIHSQED